jgi:hypothetical protein
MKHELRTISKTRKRKMMKSRKKREKELPRNEF